MIHAARPAAASSPSGSDLPLAGRSRARSLGIWLLALLGLAAITALALTVERSAAHEAEERARRAGLEVQRAIDGNILALAGLRGMLDASGTVGREPWRRYLDSIAPWNPTSTMQGLGYALAIEPNARGIVPPYLRVYGIEKDAWPSTGEKQSFPIVVLEPANARNQSALGFDMYTEAVRRRAMSRAIASRRPAVTDLVTLKQEISGPVQKGFLIYLPHLADDGRVRGFVYAPYRVEDFFRAVTARARASGLSVEVRDPGGTLVYGSGASAGQRVALPLQLADQTWSVSILTPRPALLNPTWWVIALGLLLLLLLTLAWVAQQRRVATLVRIAALETQSAEQASLLMREMAHRVKNGFARISAIASLTAKQTTTKEEFVATFSARLAALTRAKEFLLGDETHRGGLHRLLSDELALCGIQHPDRLFTGADVSLDESEYHALALILHELVTNSVKYGALADQGTLSIVTAVEDGRASVAWVEELDRPPTSESRGFGTEFIETLVQRQLRGNLLREIVAKRLSIRIEWPHAAG